MRMRRADLSQFALFKTTQISHSIFIEMKIRFLHDIPMNWSFKSVRMRRAKLSRFALLRRKKILFQFLSK